MVMRTRLSLERERAEHEAVLAPLPRQNVPAAPAEQRAEFESVIVGPAPWSLRSLLTGFCILVLGLAFFSAARD